MTTQEIYAAALNEWLEKNGTTPFTSDPNWRAHEVGLEAVVAATQARSLEEAATDAFADKKIQGLQRVVIGTWLRGRMYALADARDAARAAANAAPGIQQRVMTDD